MGGCRLAVGDSTVLDVAYVNFKVPLRQARRRFEKREARPDLLALNPKP